VTIADRSSAASLLGQDNQERPVNMQACKTVKTNSFGIYVLGLVGVGMAASVGTANAQLLNLTDQSASVLISADTQAGVFEWDVSGIDHLAKEWWWLQVGGSRFSVDALPVTSSQPAVNKAITTYTDAINGYTVEISYELTGSDFASGQSLLKEAVSIQNTSGSPLDISLFMYSDFDLGGNASGDTTSLFGVNDSDFIFGDTKGWTEASQRDGANSHGIIVNGFPLLGEVDIFANTLNKLNTSTDPLITDASLVLAPTFGSPTVSEFGPDGPADMTYAFQWDFNIAAGDGDGVGVDKSLDVTPIPEPATAALGLLALAALFRARRIG
jgi:uncharacterized protein (TIGR03382 family)